jgi:hypothetical protein
LTRISIPHDLPDLDLQIGGHLTLERADGRSVWRQRLRLVAKYTDDYTDRLVLIPVDETDA